LSIPPLTGESSEEEYYRGVAKLNVGGQTFITTNGTLCAIKGSLLEKVFRFQSKTKPPPEIQLDGITLTFQGSYFHFIDRDPTVFGLILGYLRNGGNQLNRTFGSGSEDITTVEYLRSDAEFYGLRDLQDRCDSYLTKVRAIETRSLGFNGVVKRFGI